MNSQLSARTLCSFPSVSQSETFPMKVIFSSFCTPALLKALAAIQQLMRTVEAKNKAGKQ